MYAYHIKKHGYTIGQANGQSNAFKFVQKEIDREGLQGYWKGQTYMIDSKPFFSFERVTE